MSFAGFEMGQHFGTPLDKLAVAGETSPRHAICCGSLGLALAVLERVWAGRVKLCYSGSYPQRASEG